MSSFFDIEGIEALGTDGFKRLREVNTKRSLGIIAKLEKIVGEPFANWKAMGKKRQYTLDIYGQIAALYLDDCELTEVPSLVFEIDTLERLFLTGNKLTTFTVQEGQLPNLEVLRLDGNDLNEVDESLKVLSKLQQFSIRWNFVRDRPYWLNRIRQVDFDSYTQRRHTV